MVGKESMWDGQGWIQKKLRKRAKKFGTLFLDNRELINNRHLPLILQVAYVYWVAIVKQKEDNRNQHNSILWILTT